MSRTSVETIESHFLFCEPTSQSSHGGVDGTLKHFLPAAVCANCKQITCSTFQLRPDLDIDPTDWFTDKWQVSFNEYSSVLLAHPELNEIQPGAYIGIMTGLAKGRIEQITWAGDGTPLFRESVVEVISSMWPELNFYPTDIAKLRGEPLFCPDLPNYGTIADSELESVLVAPCATCGFFGKNLKGKFIVNLLPPDGIPLCRLIDFGGYLIANREFHDLVHKMNWKGARFEDLASY